MFELHFRPLLAHRIISVVFILIIIGQMVVVWNQGDLRNSLLISTFLLIGLKYFLGVLVIKVDITKESIRLGRTFGDIQININDVDKLAIRYVNSSKLDEFPESYKYLEIFIKGGKHYIYPMSSGRKSLREDEIKSITGLSYQKLPKLSPRITNQYLLFNLWV